MALMESRGSPWGGLSSNWVTKPLTGALDLPKGTRTGDPGASFPAMSSGT